MRELVGRNVRRIRLENGLTQEDLAVRSGFSQQYLSDLERGLRNPTVVSLFELAQALGVSHMALVTPDLVFASPEWPAYPNLAENGHAFVDFADLTLDQRAEAARILRDALAHAPAAWNGPGEAEAEVSTFFSDPDRAAFALMEGGQVIGWIGRVESYSHAWELHPLVVDPPRQRRGLGAALVAELERRARAAGVLTLHLGTDDDFGGTNLFGRDLFPNVLAHVDGLAPALGHPFVFYRKLGFEVVGLMPDANGPGQPDIFMAKRIVALPKG